MHDQPLAYMDRGFLESDDARPIRILAEYLEPLRRLKEQNIQDTVRLFFAAAGINTLPPNSLFFNDRTGVLLVRATSQELDIVQKAIETLREAALVGHN